VLSLISEPGPLYIDARSPFSVLSDGMRRTFFGFRCGRFWYLTVSVSMIADGPKPSRISAAHSSRNSPPMPLPCSRQRQASGLSGIGGPLARKSDQHGRRHDASRR
jgi:hypothetical protein